MHRYPSLCFQAGNWILMFSILAKILVVGCRIYLYIKRDMSHHSRAHARHHNTLASTFVSFSSTEQQRIESGHFPAASSSAAATTARATPAAALALDDAANDDDDTDGVDQTRPLLRRSQRSHPQHLQVPDSMKKRPQSTPKQPQQLQATNQNTSFLSHVDVHAPCDNDGGDEPLLEADEHSFKYNTL